MTFRGILVAAAVSAFLASGCCEACKMASGVAKEIQGPPDSEGEALVKQHVVNEEDLRKKICGVDTAELTNLVVKKTPEGNYSIRGTPVEKPLALSGPAKPAPSASSKPLTNAKQMLECVAAVSIVWHLEENKGSTTWSISRVNVEEITTPGSEYKRPKSRDWD